MFIVGDTHRDVGRIEFYSLFDGDPIGRILKMRGLYDQQIARRFLHLRLPLSA